MAGGSAVTLNPEPVADAVDVFFLGDGEPVVPALHDAFADGNDYEDFLDRLQGVPGVYLPARTVPKTHGNAILGFDGPPVVLSVENPLKAPGHTAIITEHTVFRDMYMMEIARGCPYQCKFCTAREIYSPFRPVKIDHLRDVLDEARGFGRKIGLVSTSLNNHPQSAALFQEINKRGMKIAPPSLRLQT